MKRTVSIGQNTGKVLKVTFSGEDASSLSGGSPKLGMHTCRCCTHEQHYAFLVFP